MSRATEHKIIDGDGHVVEDIATIWNYMPQEYVGKSFSDMRGRSPFPPIDHLHNANRHFTPKGASWINLVERWFAALTEKQIRRGVHRSTRDLEAAIDRYLTAYNEAPTPFVWTKTADEILASVARFCQRTSNSIH